jgi:hypothetical protein
MESPPPGSAPGAPLSLDGTRTGRPGAVTGGANWHRGGTTALDSGGGAECFRDNLDPTVPDVVDFYGRPINDKVDNGAWGASLGDPYEFHFTVGRGAFVLKIR